jgi:hypothetical protein
MTAQQPEHCSCESRCIWYPSWDENLKKPCSMIHSCTSRPHHPAPAASCQTCVSEMAAFCSDCDRVHSKITTIRGYGATIARTATLAENKRVLDKMAYWLKSNRCPPTKKKGDGCDGGCGMCMIESLRAAAQEDTR